MSATGLAPAQEAVASVVAAKDDWMRRYAFYLVLLDLSLLGVSGIAAVTFRFGDVDTGVSLGGTSYFLIAGLLCLGWLVVLGLGRCYETRFLGTGPEEYRRVANACLRLTAAIALVAYSFKLEFARGFVGIFLVFGTVALLSARAAARARLRRGRRNGRWTHRVLVVGARAQVAELAAQFGRDPAAGYRIVGACVPGGGTGPITLSDGTSVPISGSLAQLTQALLAVRADTVAVAASPEITGEALRRLSYELEGTGTDLLVAPALTNVSGTRVSIRPLAGLPLLHLDEPELTGARTYVKAGFDLIVAAALLVLLSPLLLLLAAAVRLTSHGPALFRQVRVGRRGKLFRVYKFRTMHADAEGRLAELAHLNEFNGLLFKLRDDPRVTRVGRLLRRYSLDELPQLLNVLRGQMSLVGPRPPLPSEVERYQGHARRRLLVKPGITGLWQVSGRSDLSWEDTVRLDLQYVENWSLSLDIAVLGRTAAAVLGRRGAY